MLIQENYSLSDLNTLQLKSQARYLANLTNISNLAEIARFIKQNQLSYFVLGGGSNLVLPELYSGLVICNQLSGFKKIKEDTQYVWIKAMAGIVWDEFVAYTLSFGWFGLENLSLIPGTVGAAPIQNIGAYGVEVKDFIDYVEVYDLEQECYLELTNHGCNFSYRSSIFKSTPQYIVTAVVFKLLRQEELNLKYADLKLKMSEYTTQNAQGLRDCVIRIRQSKLPDTKQIGNVGSFFHNPILTISQVKQLQIDYPDLPVYPINSSIAKVSAGWLIDKLGLKGYIQGNVGVYAKQALVLVNHGCATQTEILDLAKFIQSKVFERYNIQLNIEPIIISS